MHPEEERLAAASLPRDWIFTFGYDHEHPITGEPLRNMYVVFHGTSEEARTQMIDMFGNKWSHQYPTEEAAGVAKYKLQRLEFGTPYTAAELE